MSNTDTGNQPFRPHLKLDHLPRWVHSAAIGASLAATLLFVVVFLVFKNVDVWGSWEAARELHSPSYGERIYEESIFRTRMNTWSNLAYIFVGFYAIALAVHDRRMQRPLLRGYLAHTPAQSFLFGAICIYLGLGSGLFHASLTRVGQQCDVGAMYALLVSYTAMCVGSWFPRLSLPGSEEGRPTWPFLVAAAAAASILFTYYKWSLSFDSASRPLTYTLIAFAVFSLVHPRRKLYLRFFLGGICVFAAGAYIRQLDIDDKFTGPDSLFQGHAIWHVMTAVYIAFTYLYFRSEERR